ncbi:MAG: hypothetical protein AB1656_26090 [Candidatus Omnitrophota bacterium]
METKVLPFNRTPAEENQVALFYLERILDLTDSGCVQLAKNVWKRNKGKFQSLISANHYQRLEEKTNQTDDWSAAKEKEFFERMENARIFCEFKSVHNFGREIILHHIHRADECPSHEIVYKVQERLAVNNVHYIEPDEVAINTFLDARIQFIVDQRRPSRQNSRSLEGNPGFYLTDVLGRRYRCFVKQVDDVKINDVLKLKITNIPGPALTNGNGSEPIVYFEPRVMPGDLIDVGLTSLSHTSNSFIFRHFSYDGFLWFKRRGVNKEIFNRNTLRPNDRVVAKVLYTTEEAKLSSSGKLTRLGIIKAIPIKRAEKELRPADDQDIGVAKVLS